MTASLDAIDVGSAFTAQSRQDVSVEDLASIAATYRLLLCIPIEYLTRNIRNDLMRRALTADVVCVQSPSPSLTYAPLFFREFLTRLFQFMGGVEHGVSDSSIKPWFRRYSYPRRRLVLISRSYFTKFLQTPRKPLFLQHPNS